MELLAAHRKILLTKAETANQQHPAALQSLALLTAKTERLLAALERLPRPVRKTQRTRRKRKINIGSRLALNLSNRLTRAHQRLREPLPETWILKAAFTGGFLFSKLLTATNPLMSINSSTQRDVSKSKPLLSERSNVLPNGQCCCSSW